MTYEELLKSTPNLKEYKFKIVEKEASNNIEKGELIMTDLNIGKILLTIQNNKYQVRIKILRYIFNLTAEEVAEYVGISRQYLSEIENLKKPLTRSLELAFKYLYEEKYRYILDEHIRKNIGGLPVPIYLCNRLDRLKFEDILLMNSYIDKRRKYKDFDMNDIFNICDSYIIVYMYKGKIIYKHKAGITNVCNLTKDSDVSA